MPQSEDLYFPDTIYKKKSMKQYFKKSMKQYFKLFY